MPREDNEITEMWAQYREQRQEKKRRNRSRSTQMLDDARIEYIAHNNGIAIADVRPTAYRLWSSRVVRV